MVGSWLWSRNKSLCACASLLIMWITNNVMENGKNFYTTFSPTIQYITFPCCFLKVIWRICSLALKKKAEMAPFMGHIKNSPWRPWYTAQWKHSAIQFCRCFPPLYPFAYMFILTAIHEFKKHPLHHIHNILSIYTNSLILIPAWLYWKIWIHCRDSLSNNRRWLHPNHVQNSKK